MIHSSGCGPSFSTLLVIHFPHITTTDIRIAMDVFVSMMFIEGLIKPVAIRVAKLIMYRIDKKIDVVPDWLHEK